MRVFLRVVEALLAVFALLVTHQLFWLLFLDLQPRLRCPNPPVFLFADLGGPQPSASPCGMRLSAPKKTSHDRLFLRGHAPDHQPVQIWVNETATTTVFARDGRLEATVPLRRGLNRIGASIQTSWDTPRAPAYTVTVVEYAPEQPLLPKLVGFIPREKAGEKTGEKAGEKKAGEKTNVKTDVAVVGLGEPRRTVLLLTDDRPVRVSTDVLGMFSHTISSRAGQRVEIRVANDDAGLKTSQPTVWSEAPYARWDLARHVSITVAENGSYRIGFRAEIPDGTALQQYAGNRQLTADEFIRNVFGLEIIAGFLAPIGPDTRPKAVPGDPPAIRLDLAGTLEKGSSLAVSPAFSTVPPLAAATDEIQLTVEGAVPTTIEYPPTNTSTDGRTHSWRGPYKWMDGTLFKVGAETSMPPPAPSYQPSSINLVQFLRQLQSLVWAVAARLAWALLSAAPFIALWWILRRSVEPGPSRYTTDLRALTVTFLIFHLAVLAWPVFGLWFGELQSILVGAGAVSRGGEAARTLKDVGFIAPFLVIGVMLLIKPLYRAAQEPTTAGVPSPFWNVVRFLVLWPAAVVIPVVLFASLVTIRTALRPLDKLDVVPLNALMSPLVIFGAGTLLVWIFLYWFLRITLGVAITVPAAIMTSMAMIVLPAVPWALDSLAGFVRYRFAGGDKISPVLLPAEIEGPVSLTIVIVVGAALLIQVTRISSQLTTRANVAARAWSWPTAGLVVAFAVLSLPSKAVVGTVGVHVSDLTTLAYAIDRLLPYALLLGMVLFLRHSNPGDSFTIARETRYVGALMFAFFLAGRTVHLLFVPIPLIAGWCAFVYWLAASRRVEAAGADASARRQLIAKLLDYRRIRALVDDLRKGLGKKCADGTLTLTEYRMRINEGERHLAQAEAALSGPVTTVKERIFGHGPENGPWANAQTAMGFGLILSIPFQLVTLANAFQKATIGPYPLLGLTEALAFSVSTWLVIACLFGYFFHLIPGRAGIDKAWIFGGALLLATFPAAIIQPGAAPTQQVAQLLPLAAVVPWLAYILVVTFVLVLALLFDVRTIQAAGYSWRDLIAVHGLTTISAYASSILVASVASIKGWDAIKAIWDFIRKSMPVGPH